MVSTLDQQIEKLLKCELIKESEVKALCNRAREILVEEANVQRVDLPVTVTLSFFFSFLFFPPTTHLIMVMVMITLNQFLNRFVGIFMDNFMI